MTEEESTVAGLGATTSASKALVVVWPAASVAVHETLVVPTASTLPDAGVQATVGSRSTLSVAEVL